MVKMNKIKISDNFYLYEFQSPDTKEVKVDAKIVRKLQKLRKLVNDLLGTPDTPLFITSGYRTWEHHVSIYKEDYGTEWEEYITDNSLHLDGKAVDIASIDGLSNKKLAKLAEQVGFDGIGVYSWGVHVDVREGQARWGW